MRAAGPMPGAGLALGSGWQAPDGALGRADDRVGAGAARPRATAAGPGRRRRRSC